MIWISTKTTLFFRLSNEFFNLKIMVFGFVLFFFFGPRAVFKCSDRSSLRDSCYRLVNVPLWPFPPSASVGELGRPPSGGTILLNEPLSFGCLELRISSATRPGVWDLRRDTVGNNGFHMCGQGVNRHPALSPLLKPRQQRRCSWGSRVQAALPQRRAPRWPRSPGWRFTLVLTWVPRFSPTQPLILQEARQALTQTWWPRVPREQERSYKAARGRWSAGTQCHFGHILLARESHKASPELRGGEIDSTSCWWECVHFRTRGLLQAPLPATYPVAVWADTTLHQKEPGLSHGPVSVATHHISVCTVP